MKINKQVLFIVCFIFICHILDKTLYKDNIEGFNTYEIYNSYYNSIITYILDFFGGCREGNYRNPISLKCEHNSCLNDDVDNKECLYYTEDNYIKHVPCHLMTPPKDSDDNFCSNSHYQSEENCPQSRCEWINADILNSDTGRCLTKKYCNLKYNNESNICSDIDNGKSIRINFINQYIQYEDPLKEFVLNEHPDDIDSIFDMMKNRTPILDSYSNFNAYYNDYYSQLNTVTNENHISTLDLNKSNFEKFIELYFDYYYKYEVYDLESECNSITSKNDENLCIFQNDSCFINPDNINIFENECYEFKDNSFECESNAFCEYDKGCVPCPIGTYTDVDNPHICLDIPSDKVLEKLDKFMDNSIPPVEQILDGDEIPRKCYQSNYPDNALCAIDERCIDESEKIIYGEQHKLKCIGILDVDNSDCKLLNTDECISDRKCKLLTNDSISYRFSDVDNNNNIIYKHIDDSGDIYENKSFNVTNIIGTIPSEPFNDSCESCEYTGHLYKMYDSPTDLSRNINHCGLSDKHWTKYEITTSDDNTFLINEIQIPDTDLDENGDLPCNINTHYNLVDKACDSCPSESPIAVQYHPLKYEHLQTEYDDGVLRDHNICSDRLNDIDDDLNTRISACESDNICKYYFDPDPQYGGLGKCDYNSYSKYDNLYNDDGSGINPDFDWVRTDNNLNPIMDHCESCHSLGKAINRNNNPDNPCRDCENGMLKEIEINGIAEYRCIGETFCNDELDEDNPEIGYNIVDDLTSSAGRCKCSPETFSNNLNTAGDSWIMKPSCADSASLSCRNDPSTEGCTNGVCIDSSNVISDSKLTESDCTGPADSWVNTAAAFCRETIFSPEYQDSITPLCNIKENSAEYFNLNNFQNKEFLDVDGIKDSILSETDNDIKTKITNNNGSSYVEYLNTIKSQLEGEGIPYQNILNNIALERESVCYYNGSLGNCDECTENNLNDEDDRYIPDITTNGKCIAECPNGNSDKIERKCGNICEIKNSNESGNGGKCYPHSKYTSDMIGVNLINDDDLVFNFNNMNTNYIYNIPSSMDPQNNEYHSISHIKHDKFFNSITSEITQNQLEDYIQNRYIHGNTPETTGIINSYKKAEMTAQSILCDPETTPDISIFNSCQVRWNCPGERNSEIESEIESETPQLDESWSGDYLPLPHGSHCGTDNELCNTLPNLFKIDALGENFACHHLTDEKTCNDSNRCYYNNYEEKCREYNIIDRYSSGLNLSDDDNSKKDFIQGGILNGNRYGSFYSVDDDETNELFSSNYTGLIGRHELTFSIIDTPYKVTSDASAGSEQVIINGPYFGSQEDKDVIEEFVDYEESYLKKRLPPSVEAEAASVLDAVSDVVYDISPIKRSKEAQVDLLLSDEDADFSLFSDPSKKRKVDLYDPCNQYNETSKSICESKYVDLTNTDSLLDETEIESARCKYNKQTNECYSIENPLKAYSKSNNKITSDTNPNTFLGVKDYDQMKYFDEKKNLHNKPVSFYGDSNISEYTKYYTHNNTNWNLYGGCDIESTPDPENYSLYVSDKLNDNILTDDIQLGPIKKRHKQLIKQYVESNESKNEDWNDEEYDKLFNYISDAYNYKRPLILDIHPELDANEHNIKKDENGNILYDNSCLSGGGEIGPEGILIPSCAQDDEYLPHCEYRAKWKLPFSANSQSDINSKNIAEYVNFPQCVQTIYNYHYLNNSESRDSEGRQINCNESLLDSANIANKTTLFNRYGLNTSDYNELIPEDIDYSSDVTPNLQNPDENPTNRSSKSGLYNWFFGRNPENSAGADISLTTTRATGEQCPLGHFGNPVNPTPSARAGCGASHQWRSSNVGMKWYDWDDSDYVMSYLPGEDDWYDNPTTTNQQLIARLDDVILGNQRAFNECDAQFYNPTSYCEAMYKDATSRCSNYLYGLGRTRDLGSQVVQCDDAEFLSWDYPGVYSLDDLIDYRNELFAEAERRDEGANEYYEDLEKSERLSYIDNLMNNFHINSQLLDEGLRFLQDNIFGESSDEINSHSSSEIKAGDVTNPERQKFLGYDYYNYCNSDISKFPYAQQYNNQTACDYEIGSIYSQFTSSPINSDAYYTNYLLFNSGINPDGPGSQRLYRENRTSPGDNTRFESNLIYPTSVVTESSLAITPPQSPPLEPTRNNMLNMVLPGDNNKPGDYGYGHYDWLRAGSPSITEADVGQLGVSALQYSDDMFPSIHPEFNLYNCSSSNDSNCRQDTQIKSTSLNKPLYRLWGDHIINHFDYEIGTSLRSQLDINNQQDISQIYTDPFHRMNVRKNVNSDRRENSIDEFEPIVNNNMIWSTVDTSINENLNYIPPESYTPQNEITLKSNPLNPEIGITGEQSFFIEKYCGLLSFPETHPSNNINYGIEYDINSLDISDKQRIIDQVVDCDSDDTDCETYKGDILDGANSTDSVNNWLNNLFGIGFDYTNYILDCIPSFVNNDDKWNHDDNINDICDNTKQIIENDLANKFSLKYKHNMDIKYSSFEHQKYPKIDESNTNEDDIYNNLTRVRVGGYCNGDNCDDTVKKPIEVDQRCVGKTPQNETEGYCFTNQQIVGLGETDCLSGSRDDGTYNWEASTSGTCVVSYEPDTIEPQNVSDRDCNVGGTPSRTQGWSFSGGPNPVIRAVSHPSTGRCNVVIDEIITDLDEANCCEGRSCDGQLFSQPRDINWEVDRTTLPTLTRPQFSWEPDGEGVCTLNYNEPLFTGITTEDDCTSEGNNVWFSESQLLGDQDKIGLIQQNNLKCANTNLNKGNLFRPDTNNLYEENKESCEGNTDPSSDNSQCEYIPPRNIINLQKSKYQFMLYDHNVLNGDITELPQDESLTKNNIMWENVILDKMRHICDLSAREQAEDGGDEEIYCSDPDNDEATVELREWLFESGLVSENNINNYACSWIEEEDYCVNHSPQINIRNPTGAIEESVSVCNYNTDLPQPVCELNNQIIENRGYDPDTVESCDNDEILIRNRYDPSINNGYIPDIFMIDDECVSCPVGQSRDPTDPTRCFAYRCGDLNADEINRVCGPQGRIIDNDHYVNEQGECCTSCDGQLVRDPTDPTRCTSLSTTMVQDVTIPEGGLGGPSVTTPMPTPITGGPVYVIGTTTRPTRPTRPDPPTLTCGQQYPDYDENFGQNVCTAMSPVYGGDPIWSPNNEYILTQYSRDEREYFYNTCC